MKQPQNLTKTKSGDNPKNEDDPSNERPMEQFSTILAFLRLQNLIGWVAEIKGQTQTLSSQKVFLGHFYLRNFVDPLFFSKCTWQKNTSKFVEIHFKWLCHRLFSQLFYSPCIFQMIFCAEQIFFSNLQFVRNLFQNFTQKVIIFK